MMNVYVNFIYFHNYLFQAIQQAIDQFIGDDQQAAANPDGEFDIFALLDI